MRGRADRLFQAVVVMGAAIGAGACGGDTSAGNSASGGGGSGGTEPDGASGSGGTRADAGPSEPSDCPNRRQFRCDAYFPHENCRCDPEVPVSGADCDFAPQFECECRCAPGEICSCELGSTTGVSICRCNTNAPRGPMDCVATADFHCEYWEPEPRSCVCLPGSPMTREHCPLNQIWRCVSYEPPVDCKCMTIITAPA